MRFATLALIATASAKITVSIDDKLLSNIGDNWQKAEWKLQQTLEKL